MGGSSDREREQEVQAQRAAADRFFAPFVVFDVASGLFVHREGMCVQRHMAERFTMARALDFVLLHPDREWQIESCQ